MPGSRHPRPSRRTRPVTVGLGALAVVVLLGALLVAVRASPRQARPAAGRGTVVRVVDGDTVVVRIGHRDEPVRLIGIDTPESVARDRPNECYGAEASHRLAELLPPGSEVDLTRDVEPRDVYDRLLAYVNRSSDGLFVNAAQVGEGYAIARDYPPNTTHRDDFERAERAARAGSLGLWAACGGADVPLADVGAAP